MTTFLNNNGELTVKPTELECDLVAGKVYDLRWNDRYGYSYLKENGKLNMPKKVYEVQEDTDFINRILTYFNSEKAGQTTGVLLAGDRGTGKTVCSKRIALQSNLPIIVVSTQYPVWEMSDFFKKITDPVVILFDELEKNDKYWNTRHLLSFLDGVELTAKKLVLMTVNETRELDINLFDRCSRVRYHRKYEANSNDIFLTEFCKDKGVKNVEEVVDFIKNNIKFRSFDNVSSFIDEVLVFNNTLTLEEVLKYMNLTTIKNKDSVNSEETDNTDVSDV